MVAGKFQPRRHFAAAELAALAESIRKHGVLQPIVVRPRGGKFEIIAGERRWRAAKMAGLAAAPAVVRDVGDEEAQIFALIENLQRQDLNHMEQANGLARLVDELNLTHAQAGEKVGMSRAAVSNLLRLRELAAGAQALLLQGAIEMGHARALLPLPKGRQEALAKEAARRNWTTRETERQVRAALRGDGGRAGGGAGGKNADTRRLERELSAALPARVEINHRPRGGGKMLLHYASLDALDKIIKKLR